MDVLLKDKSYVFDINGTPETVEGMDEIVQRVIILANMQKGTFAYNREIGSEVKKILNHVIDHKYEPVVKEVEMLINESIIDLKDTYVTLNNFFVNERNIRKANMTIVHKDEIRKIEVML